MPGLPGFTLNYPFANRRIDSGMDDGLIEIDDEREFPGIKEVVGCLAFDALRLLEGNGGAKR